ncbi:SDR family NAD(P)-dependent oxidoreductase [uncultured Cytophaga sp.]|uniref:SDR family NAD(P)-dependent oxidoreductase n=1 Tax=uncultured Cytophaga sp. TaxID=160238 RepID=UPI00262D3EC0|nr:SDR family NAD(P)-dependent oxidoreductase [uncultured Cytophaga sp.]
MHSLKNKTILVTGGTGSLGSKLIDRLLHTQSFGFKKIIIFSRDELKQSEMGTNYQVQVDAGKIEFILGDIRDVSCLSKALMGVDVVFHTAALKHVPATENNPRECIKTNIIGAMNLIDACLEQNVSKVIALSTDKAASPESVYGASKLISDKLFVDANKYSKTKFSIVRFGNILGSRGSVLPLFLEQKNKRSLTITHPEMTRFCITFNEAVNVLLFACEHCLGGEVLIPKSPSFHIEDLADVVCIGCEKNYIGIRMGEKLHEDMITEDDARNTWESDAYFILLPNKHDAEIELYWTRIFNAHKLEKSFCLRSDNNPTFLSKQELTTLIETV